MADENPDSAFPLFFFQMYLLDSEVDVALQIARKNRFIKICREIFLNRVRLYIFFQIRYFYCCLEIRSLLIQFNPDVTNFKIWRIDSVLTQVIWWNFCRNSRSKFCIESINFDITTKFWFFSSELREEFHNKLFKHGRLIESNFNFQFLLVFIFIKSIIIPCYRKNWNLFHNPFTFKN